MSSVLGFAGLDGSGSRIDRTELDRRSMSLTRDVDIRVDVAVDVHAAVES
jgi:hypothetical protein